MKLVTVSLLAILSTQVNNVYAEDKSEVLKDDTAKLNYSVGYQIGSDFKAQEFEVRPEAVLRGIQDAMSGANYLMSREEMRKTMADLGNKVAELKKKNRQQATSYAEQNKQFLVENGKKKGVITTASGLQYRVNKSGHRGEHPGINDSVLVHYRGRLINGTQFDSSIKRGKPASFKVNQVIKGWTEALQLMKQGGHWQLFVPAELAYGTKGAGSSVPPNSTLIFDIELIAIQG